MAEVLGVVASGIAVGTLAAKVAKTTVKLKDVWQQVKDAPDDISHLLREIECFELILNETCQTLSLPGMLFDNACLQKPIKLCAEALDDLSELVDEMADKIETKRKWKEKMGSLKIVLKKDEVDRVKGRLESAIRLLSMAYQCHTRCVHENIAVTRTYELGR
jgi:hypothetical protein